MAGGGTDKRNALERRRKIGRAQVAFVAFATGCAFGASAASIAMILSGSDTVPPSIVAVSPDEDAILAAGEHEVRLAFSEPLQARPRVTFDGTAHLTLAETTFDGQSWRGALEIPRGSDGTYRLHVAGLSDPHGNRQRDLSFAYRIDSTPPTSHVFVSANETTVPFNVTWEATDSGSGIARVELWWRENGSAWSLLTTSSQDRGTDSVDPGERMGVFGFTARAVDQAGNREDGPFHTAASVYYNGLLKNASLLPPAGYWFRAPPALSAIANSNVTSVDLRYRFAPDNATWQGPFSAGKQNAPFAWTFAFPLGPGHYRLAAQAEDALGTQEPEPSVDAAEVFLGFDPTAPETYLSPPPSYWQSAPVVVSANGTDDRSGIDRFELFSAYRPNRSAPWSSWTIASARAEPPWTFTFDFPQGDGRYALTARAIDNGGNQAPLPADGAGDVEVGYDATPPIAPTLFLPTYINPATRSANLTWLANPGPDMDHFELHRGVSSDFQVDESPCAISATCVRQWPPSDRYAWVPLPDENVTHWFRVRSVDDGGSAATSGSVGANFHGIGFDTPESYAEATAIPLGAAWSERLHLEAGCTDCIDYFQIELDRAGDLRLQVAVPPTGNFRVTVGTAAFRFIASIDVGGLGAWENLTLEGLDAGWYYVIIYISVDIVPYPRNEGWYTLTANLER